MKGSHRQLLAFAQANGLIRSRDLNNLGVPRTALAEMLELGCLVKITRGLYTLPEHTISEHQTLSEISYKYPNTIICLLSALRFHNLTTQSPPDVWVAIPNKSRAPKIDYPPLRVVWFSGLALQEGIEKYNISGINIQITNIPRTVMDCFKYRNKIGLDVAIEALNESWHQHLVNMEIYGCTLTCFVSPTLCDHI